MKKKIAISLVLFGVLASPASSQQLKPVMKIVAQPSAPVTITSYDANYESRSSQYATRGIHHNLKYENTGTKDISALQFGLVSFNVWNEFLDRTNGIDMDALALGRSKSGGWVATSYADFSFLTGVAYVKRVRFSDGEIWTADEAGIVEELRTIEKNFDAKNLATPEGPPN